MVTMSDGCSGVLLLSAGRVGKILTLNKKKFLNQIFKKLNWIFLFKSDFLCKQVIQGNDRE